MPASLPPKVKQLTYKYREFLLYLHKQFMSGKLREEQRIKIFFIIKSEEIKNMTHNDLLRMKKKYERTLKVIKKTIEYLERKKPVRDIRRLKLEKYAQKQSQLLLKKIDALLIKR